ncbi:hypothetical protein MFERI15181_00053 [Mycoplasma feriruminatoris]|uniref:Uncharacterized protein n=1 Tax=Mycoplasma feriruminatoris TaxID=1179777 RepID=A0ABY8HU80_9MOLU|nr:hypothetical protein [Mycoplasma feriruminatoris]WFQ93168.1 hypothetical protein MFERI15181_00053 [Mycoplasma feriruminatoris]
MKKYFCNLKTSISQNKKQYLIRLGCLLIGLYLFSLSIALYVPTAVGASHVDFTNFSILALFKDWIKVDGKTVEGTIDPTNYKSALLSLYAFLLFVSIVFLTISIIREYRVTKDKKLWLQLIPLIVLDMIINVGLSYVIEGQIQMLVKIGYMELMNNTPPYQYRTIFFTVAFVLYIAGLTFWIHSGWLLGSYNSINTNFMRLTKLPFNVSRVLMDVLIIVPGVIMFLVNPISWDIKAKFLLNYVNIGTIGFLFLAGPLLGKTLGLLNKITKIYQ